MRDLTLEGIEVFAIVQDAHSITVRSLGPDVFTLTTEDGPMFGPVPGDRIFEAAAAVSHPQWATKAMNNSASSRVANGS